MYRMQDRKKGVRIYVRNKSRYNPEKKERDFLFVDVTNFAGTTIGDLKENIRRQTKSTVKIDELFRNNIALADDRSVAHYNLEDGCILETTSNPLWVSCLYIKAAEVKQQQQLHTTDEEVQKWTSKSLPKKYVLIGILLNSSNAFRSQPPHFPTLDDFVLYLERLGKKGATMHPNYTRADLAKMEMEFHRDFENKFDDPLAAFIDHHAVQLGFINPSEAENKLRQHPNMGPVNLGIVDYPRNNGVKVATSASNAGRAAGSGIGAGNRNNNKRQVEVCEDCETLLAVLYCTDCQNATDVTGISLCKRCCDVLHTGATRRRHNIVDISQAPKASGSKPYVPRAFLAPFAIVLAMYSALSDRVPKLSMTEDEIKRRAQSLTDTDLQDKQNGKYVGGFDCMENCLMAKGLVKKEAARTPTYALTDIGHDLGEKLYLFYRTLFAYLSSCHLPKLQDSISTTCIGNRKICLLIDENEREKGRLLKLAEDKGIDAQTRYLPAGDYIWILTPPMIDTRQKYTGNQSDAEVVLPFIVERKSWEDFGNSVNCTRFQRQVNNMLGSGVKNCFYLMEGSPGALRYNATQHQQQLKTMVERLIFDYGFYVNYTSSWMKSAQWLLWFSQLIVDSFKQGELTGNTIQYRDYSSRVAVLNGGPPTCFHGNEIRKAHTWPAQLFVDHIFRDELGERTLLRTVQEDLGLQGREQHLLVIQGLEQYNKKRQSTLNKCCTEVYGAPEQAEEIVEGMIGGSIHNMVHYDITCYRQLYIQVMTGVYIMRTESDKETEQAHREFMEGPDPQSRGSNRGKQPVRKLKSTKINTQSRISTHDAMGLSTKTVSSGNNVLNTSDELRLEKNISHDLPPGCWTADVPLTRHVGQSRTESGETFKAFSGTGFTLGSGTTLRGDRRPTATVTSEDQIKSSDDSVAGKPWMPFSKSKIRNQQPGPYSDTGERNYNNVSDDVLGIVRMPLIGINSRGDFASCQNEDEILKEVLNSSRRDAAAVETDSQQDPELQLALLLSREEIQNNAISPDKYYPSYSGSAPNSIEASSGPVSIDTGSQENDEELKLVIELSKQDRKQTNNENVRNIVNRNDLTDVNTPHVSVKEREAVLNIEDSEKFEDEEVQLKIALELSKQTTTPLELIEEDSDIHLLEAVERSKTDHTPVKISDGSDQLKLVIERSKYENSHHKTFEDLHLQKAIERSRCDHTPQKTEADLELKQAIERSKIEHSQKRSDVDIEDAVLKIAIERSIEDQSPKHATVTRKIDTREVCNFRKNVMKTNRDKTVEPNKNKGLDPLSIKEKISVVCSSNRAVTNNKLKEIGKEEVIQIDSQSQEIETERTELEIQFDSNEDKCEILEPIPNANNSFLPSDDKEENEYLTEHVGKNSSIQNLSDGLLNIQNHKDIMGDAEDISDVNDEDDLVPPSPNKNPSNLSQLSISIRSDTSKTESSNIERRKSKKNFNLKTCLLKFVDENNSDEENSCSDSDDGSGGNHGGAGSECNTGSDSESSKSVEDIFSQPDSDVGLNACSGKSINVSKSNSDCEKGASSNQDVPHLSNANILVSTTIVSDSVNTVNNKIKIQSNTSEIQTNLYMHRRSCVQESRTADRKKAISIKQEPCDFISSETVGQKEFSDPYTNDSEMIEVDFNLQSDDSDKDPTCETSINENSESSEQYNDDDDVDELISKVDPEFLPRISRPKKRRKKTPQKEPVKKISESQKAKYTTIKQEKLDKVDILQEIEKPEVSTEMDAALAKLLDKQINGGMDSFISNSGTVNDELFARQIQAELELEAQMKKDYLMEDIITDQYETVDKSRPIDPSDPEDLVKELQQREMEKIERMRRALDEDERLARMMQDNPEVNQEKDDVEDTDVKESTVSRNYKKLFAEDRALRERAAAQLDEYRTLQSQRYQRANTQGNNSCNGRVDREQSSSRQRNDYDVYGESTLENQHNSLNNQTFNKPFQWPKVSVSTSHLPADQVTPGSRIYQSQSSSFPFTQSDADQLTPSSQSKTAVERNVSITCGNCGEKGHTRVNPVCPKYHTADEKARREAQQERRRQQQEERKREELENVNLLANHHRAILDMNDQLEREMSTIQNDLRQRALALEKQVNSRVKKIEKTEKRKKKK